MKKILLTALLTTFLFSQTVYTEDDVFIEDYKDKGYIHVDKYHKPINGIKITTYKNGNKHWEATYKDGILNGSSITYYDTGEIWQQRYNKNGEQMGEGIGYYKTGEIESTSEWENGVIKTGSKRYYKTGEIQCISKKGDTNCYYKTGELEMNIPENSEIIRYYKTGEIEYTDGKAYYRSQKLKKEFIDIDNKGNSIEKGYYETGELHYEVPIKNYKRNGTLNKYYTTGALGIEIVMKDNKAIKGMIYKPNGEKNRETTNADYHRLGYEY